MEPTNMGASDEAPMFLFQVLYWGVYGVVNDGGRSQSSMRTVFFSVPMPPMETSTTSSGLMGAFSPREPEKTRSPGWRVTCWLM